MKIKDFYKPTIRRVVDILKCFFFINYSFKLQVNELINFCKNASL